MADKKERFRIREVTHYEVFDSTGGLGNNGIVLNTQDRKEAIASQKDHERIFNSNEGES